MLKGHARGMTSIALDRIGEAAPVRVSTYERC
jgi:hypothetical protein